jgi:hypothetical protein
VISGLSAKSPITPGEPGLDWPWLFPVLLLLWKNVLTRYWEITKNASAWRSEDTRDYAKV